MRSQAIARENPLSSGEKVAFVVGGVALVGALAYAFWPKAAAARTAQALDNYSSTLSPVVTGATTLAALTTSSFTVPGATVTGLTLAADGVSMVVTMTAPPGQTAALNAAMSNVATSLGATMTPVTDTGVAVQ